MSDLSEELFNRYREDLEMFQKWIKSRKRFPQNMDKLLLLRFLKVNDFDQENAQKLLVLYLETRAKNPELFHDRDVLNEEFERAFKTIQIMPIKKNTHKNYKVTFLRLKDLDPNNYDAKEVTRMALAHLDVKFITLDDEELIEGEIGVMDMKGYSFRHMLKAIKYMSMFREYSKYVEECLPTKIIQNHFVNCSSTVYKLVSLMKPFMKKETIDSITFHVNIETLYDHLPLELIPDEYGGKAGSMDKLHYEWLEVIKSNRDYILNDENWKIVSSDDDD